MIQISVEDANRSENFGSKVDPTRRMLGKEVIAQIVERVAGAVTGSERTTRVMVAGWWNSELRISRNRISLSSHRRDLRVKVTRLVGGVTGVAITNQLDTASLKGVTHAAERIARFSGGLVYHEGASLSAPELASPETLIWSEETFTLPAEQQALVAVELATRSEAHEMLSAGYIEARLGEVATHTLGGSSSMPSPATYTRFTQAQCSMTVRHPEGVGSGWAGLSSYDWSVLHPSQLVERALDKCLKSLNPVAIEPGRYTVVLEPQAVSSLFDSVFWAFSFRDRAERTRAHPFFLGADPALNIGRSKLGLKIVDERITVSHIPADPTLGVLPQPGMRPITWIDRGVLTSLSHERDSYSLPWLNENVADLWRNSYKMNGGNSSIGQMISQTERGLLVTRFSKVKVIDPSSVLATGLSRDGLWLIEHGKISKAIKNMRFTESMLFALNQLDSLGESMPVFRPTANPYIPYLSPAVVPSMKVRDFSFTSMIDAV